VPDQYNISIGCVLAAFSDDIAAPAVSPKVVSILFGQSELLSYGPDSRGNIFYSFFYFEELIIFE